MFMSKRAKVRSIGKKVGARRSAFAPVVLGLGVVAVSILIFHHVLSHSIAPAQSVAKITFYSKSAANTSNAEMFSVNVADKQAATDLLNAAKKLPSMPVGVTNCPKDDGSYYRVAFKDPAVTVLAHATGCQNVIIINGSSSSNKYQASPTMLKADANFWKDIHQATGKPVYPGTNTRYF